MAQTMDFGAYYFIAALAVSQLLFMGTSYFVSHRQQLVGKLLTLYCCGVIAYILSNLPLVNQIFPAFHFLTRLVAVATPAVFWMLTHRLFNDDSRIPRAFLVLICAYLILRYAAMAVLPGSLSNDFYVSLLFVHLPQLVMLLLVLHACYMAIQGYSSDLMTDRQWLRPIFVLTKGAIILVIVGSGFFSFVNDFVRSIYFIAIFSATFVFNVRMFNLHEVFGEVVKNVASTQPGAELNESEAHCYQRIIDVLSRDKLYAQPGLTLRQLADALLMKEYRLRNFINKKLHYRNFNQFINEFRLQLAVEQLNSHDDNRMLISTIAWDLGYSSPSSFNKVFKDKYGITPSEYRKRSQNSLDHGVAA